MRRTPSYLLAAMLFGAGQLASQQPLSVLEIAGSDQVGDGGPARLALLVQAEGLAHDAAGNLYIADAAAHRVRRISSEGIVTTVAGTGHSGFSGDGGPATDAQLNSPYGLAVDPAGALYIADLGNRRVRRLAPDGIIETVAGGGEHPPGGLNQGAPATSIQLEAPRNLAVDGQGNLYVADFGGHRVFRITPGGAMSTVAGTGAAGSSGTGGLATQAGLSNPAGLAVDSNGTLFIGDTGNHKVRRIAQGRIYDVAEVATPTGLAFDRFGTLHVADPAGGQIVQIPSSGPATALPLAARDVVFDLDGNLYFSGGAFVWRRRPPGGTAVFAGGGDPAAGDFGPAIDARLNQPVGVATDGDGNVYIADRENHRIRRVTPDGMIVTVAGTGLAGDTGDSGLAARATLDRPVSVSVDALGNLYIADPGKHRVRQVTPGGVILPVAETVSPTQAVSVAAGDVYIADEGVGKIYRANAGGGLISIVDGLDSPAGLALDHDGNLYFSDAGSAQVQRLDRFGRLTDIAPGAWESPRGLAIGPEGTPYEGDLLVADPGRQRVIRVALGAEDSPRQATALETDRPLVLPWDVDVGSDGWIYVADPGANRVWALAPSAIPPDTEVEAPPGILHAASLLPGPVAPGMLLVIRSPQFDDPEAAFEVMIDGGLAAILATHDQEIVVLVPDTVAGQDVATLSVSDRGMLLFETDLDVAEAVPALFMDADGHAVASNQDGSLNSSANPATRGSIVVLYGTGEGIADLPLEVRIAGVVAEVLYSGPVEEQPGLWQINARIPTGFVPPGSLPVQVRVGEASSPVATIFAD